MHEHAHRPHLQDRCSLGCGIVPLTAGEVIAGRCNGRVERQL